MKKLLPPFLLFTFSFLISNAQNVGIGNTNPQTALDVKGDIRFRGVTITLPFTPSDLDITTNKSSIFTLISSGIGTLPGINGGLDGKIITLFNGTGFAGGISIVDENNTQASATAANRIVTGNGGYIFLNQKGSITLRYDGSLLRWTIVSKNGVDDGSNYWSKNGSNIYNNGSGNVGIGNSNPAEKLDVSGNINLNGQLKVNNNAGSANQALMKDAGNNLVWADLSFYKNFVVYDCNDIAVSSGSNNCGGSWQVPTGVTTIMVECWGGGGGGATLTSGAGGGYALAKLNVVPGNTATLAISAGGNGGNYNTNGIDGGLTSFLLDSYAVKASGGSGGKSGSFTNSSGFYTPLGGVGFGVAPQLIGYEGGPSNISKLTYTQGYSGSIEQYNYADGGDAAIVKNSGGKGGFLLINRVTSTGVSYSTNVGASRNGQQGGGGGGDNNYGAAGMGGRIIIYW